MERKICLQKEILVYVRCTTHWYILVYNPLYTAQFVCYKASHPDSYHCNCWCNHSHRRHRSKLQNRTNGGIWSSVESRFFCNINIHFKSSNIYVYQNEELFYFYLWTKWNWINCMVEKNNLCHKKFLSIQPHTPRHTDQSRDYRKCCFDNDQSIAVYNFDHAIHLCILIVKFKLHDWQLNAACMLWWRRKWIWTVHNVIYKGAVTC